MFAFKKYIIKAFCFRLGCVKEATQTPKNKNTSDILCMCLFLVCRQWVNSEEISGLTLWFTKRGLEKQVSILNLITT